ncbi:MAG: hypothetical protein A3I07_01675 [Candidatus Doudnabacteria bacterium RIFCSPLOWO2_02_FULL_42_9]|uniref:Uncharacterized protein n=1 Tax=Candidatus Doudnabacteria bacterium RIFCSPHIGHO2_01_FULL_41_86 TaxID=1817821 RepID=A0A1F5N7Q9_9BACT|nr:MAG: hypothetical protein A2717_03540 [Candidatus Doudnabacteria bacterium RIFCSPHIGHO2_01_FULL_41_86]OGE85715.1 MAG: hypothetical protein A3E28_02870 [Candidatus Doudnabacteria bacterium RIFCSPHIGHO2_12_FULL_42_22]OGE87211.1 MAG: hypothetical protein A3C49_00500 [Candidatus Doudnabacteria bacterium RIFCSPHIGHO2_02_FULL_42_25]OGE92048.1 MAG: hypothetical protein A2895_00375 [Candidatus Doudnabacteria bacterium RIFCSPLOWO2_01_FULL_42_60]OGE94314.1 MAG: hypothetical protein A3K08_01180 [Candid
MKLPRTNKIASLENEAEKAVRNFFGTFSEDIRRNWAELGQEIKIKRKTHHHVSQLTSPI